MNKSFKHPKKGSSVNQKIPYNNIDKSILLVNILIHLDSALYSFLAPVFARVFFPEFSPLTALIIAYSVLASSVITKPIGSFAFGYIAKKFGPLQSISYSLLGISIGSLILGLVPEYEYTTYSSSLHFETILLVFGRIFKEVFAEGENSVVKIYITENKNYYESYRASYMFQSSSMIGIISASLVSSLLFIFELEFLWRYCFISIGALGFILYFIRVKLIRNGLDFTTEEKTHEFITKFDLWKERYKLFAIYFAGGLSHITYSIPCIVMNSLVPLVTDIRF